MVDNDLRECFSSIEPTPTEIKEYLDKFLKRYSLKLRDYTTGESYNAKDDVGTDNFTNELNNLKDDS